MYARLLLTHDGSPLADAAVPHACQLALATGAEVLLLRVSAPAGEILAEMNAVDWRENVEKGTLADTAAREAERRSAEAQDELESVASRVREAGVPHVTAEVLEGSVGETIVEFASERGCDLIVISSHGRSGLKRAVLGSVADHVARNARGAAVVLCRPETTPE